MDLKKLLAAKAAAPRKRKSFRSYPRKIRMDAYPVGGINHVTFPNPFLCPNKNNFTRVSTYVLLNTLHGYGWDLWLRQSTNDRLSEVLAGGIATHVRSSNL